MEKHQYSNKMLPRAETRALIYVGEGAQHRNVPRRDLTDEEAALYGGLEYLVNTGLYTTPDELEREEALQKTKGKGK